MKNEQTIVVVDSVKLTNHISVEKIVLCDQGHHLNSDGTIPVGKEEHFGVYFRTTLDAHKFGQQSITDWTGEGLSQNTDDLMKFFLKNK